MTRRIALISAFLLLAMLASACAAAVPPEFTDQPAQTVAASATSAPATATVPAELPTLEPTATQPGPTPEPTADLRLDPADWQNWPVVPDRVSELARQTYQRGLLAGNNGRAFSKVGDCQAIREVLLGIYDVPGSFSLSDSEQYLQETIDQFAGSFNRDGQGVKGGYNAAAVLSPLWADPQECQPGETPIECEYRVHKPSIVIISLEVWWDGRTPDRYEDYMRKIIDFYLSKGVVPVLSTKADNVEGNHAINLITAQLAYEYDLPLWNFWRAVQPMANHGLDPTRPDGFHISYDAWSVRSFTALQTLDAVWRKLNENAPSVSVTATPAPEATATAEPLGAVADSITWPDGAPAEGFVFEVAGRSGEVSTGRGLYRFDPASGAITELTERPYRLLDLSPDGSALLAGQGSGAWLQAAAANAEREPLSQAAPAEDQAALFTDDGDAVLTIDNGTLRLTPLDGSPRRNLDSSPAQPTAVLSASAERAFWRTACPEGCDKVEVYASSLDGSPAESLGSFRRPLVSPDGRYLAYLDDRNGREILAVRNLQDGSEPVIDLIGDIWVDLVWSPNSTQLAVLKGRRSDYSGKNLGNDGALITIAGNQLTSQALIELEGINPRQLYSPDGRYLYRVVSQGDVSGYTLYLDRVDLTTMQVETLPGFDFTSPDYIWIAAWDASALAPASAN